ncbi:MAG: CDP-diacylglycerol--serine O-phosphatidyltransferase [Bdellovibrionales bacterium]|nr:CDP-diacylglycerol--serine O-phosphatidyltransferase [Bdellovibrionales bacterium]
MTENQRPNHRRRAGVNIYVLPNLLTTTIMFFGFMAIIYAIRGEYLFGSYAIVAAAVFDLLDGRVARMTDTTSQFGAEYDSLCDLISFCMAPALIMYLWALQPFGRVGWLASFVFVACGALRLARFNVQSADERTHFQVLPTPMAAGIVASSVLCFIDLEIDAGRNWLLLFMTFLLGLTMVSQFRYKSFKDVNFRKKQPFTYLVIGVLVIILIATRPEVMLFGLFFSYAILGAILGVFHKTKKTTRVRRIRKRGKKDES